MFCFRDGPAWKVTNGFKKKGNETFMSEIDIGVTIKNEYYANRTRSVKRGEA